MDQVDVRSNAGPWFRVTIERNALAEYIAHCVSRVFWEGKRADVARTSSHGARAEDTIRAPGRTGNAALAALLARVLCERGEFPAEVIGAGEAGRAECRTAITQGISALDAANKREEANLAELSALREEVRELKSELEAARFILDAHNRTLTVRELN